MGVTGIPRQGRLRYAKNGVMNVLRHAGILRGAPERAASTRLAMPSDDCFVIAETTGLLEMRADLGEQVRKGQPLAAIHDIERTRAKPMVCRAGIDGIPAGRHFPGLIQIGDCLAVVACRE